MAKVSKYRENSKRAIYVTQEIDRELVAKLSPDIIRLRLESREPIFLYLDSNGGSIFYAERLLDLIKAPNQSGERCELVSVGFGLAASAAADLLALGDYSIVYPKAAIVYHGTRQSKNTITLEDIPTLAHSLRETNERYAMRLASRMFRRLVFTMIALSIEEPDKPEEQFTFEQGIANPQAFFEQLSKHVSEDTKRNILDEAQKRQKKLTDLVTELDTHPHPSADGSPLDLDSEAKLLKGIIDFEISRLKLGGTKALGLEHLHIIQDDFVQLYDFYSGRYRKELEKIVRDRGRMFLSKEEGAEFDQIPVGESARRDAFLLGKGAIRLNPLWHFAVSICRILQSADYVIPPVDAYWLGLVDEVSGTQLLCLRSLEEEAAKQKEKEEEAAKQKEKNEEAVKKKESLGHSEV